MLELFRFRSHLDFGWFPGLSESKGKPLLEDAATPSPEIGALSDGWCCINICLFLSSGVLSLPWEGSGYCFIVPLRPSPTWFKKEGFLNKGNGGVPHGMSTGEIILKAWLPVEEGAPFGFMFFVNCSPLVQGCFPFSISATRLHLQKQSSKCKF